MRTPFPTPGSPGVDHGGARRVREGSLDGVDERGGDIGVSGGSDGIRCAAAARSPWTHPFALTGSHPATGVIMASLSRTPADTWEMRAIGQFASGRTVKKLVDPASRALNL